MASLGDSLNSQAFHPINSTLDRVETTTRETPTEESSIDSYGRNVREKFKIGEELHHWKARARFHPQYLARRQYANNDRPTNLKNSKSFSDMPTMMKAPPSQNARMLPQAASFGGFSLDCGGDTQIGNTQIYEKVTNIRKSIVNPVQEPRVQGTRDSEDDTTLHTVVEGQAGHINLIGGWGQDHHSQEGHSDLIHSSSEDELSQQSQFHVKKPSSDTLAPKTPVVAGSKRNYCGEIVSSTSAKTPGTNLTAVFGKRDDAGPDMSMSQMFNATQARSSPLPEGLRSDPVFQRPSPNIETYRHSSPIAPTSSPTKDMRSDFSRAVTEPREFYLTMQESQKRREMRRQKKEEEERRLRSNIPGHMDDGCDDDFDDMGMGPIQQDHAGKAKSTALKKLNEIAGSKSGHSIKSLGRKRRELSSSAHSAPARRSEKSGVLVEISDDGRSDDDEEDVVSNDEYDELSQDVRKSQAQYEQDEAVELAGPTMQISAKQNGRDMQIADSSPSSQRTKAMQMRMATAEGKLQVAGSQQSNDPSSEHRSTRPNGSTQSGVVADSQPTNPEEPVQVSSQSLPRASTPKSQPMDSEIRSWTPTRRNKVRTGVGNSSPPALPSTASHSVHNGGGEEAIPRSTPSVPAFQEVEVFPGYSLENGALETPSNHGICGELVAETVAPGHSGVKGIHQGDPPASGPQGKTFTKNTKDNDVTSPASAIPETDPVELPSTPSREVTSQTRARNDRPADTAAASATPSRSTAAYDTARSHLSPLLRTPYSSQRSVSFKGSPGARRTRKLTDIAADPTPPHANTQVDLDDLDPIAAEDEFFKVINPKSPSKRAKRRRVDRTNPAAGSHHSSDTSLTKSTARENGRDSPSKNQEISLRQTSDETITKQTQANAQAAVQPRTITKAKIPSDTETHIRKSGRALKPAPKLRDQLQAVNLQSSSSPVRNNDLPEIDDSASAHSISEDTVIAQEMRSITKNQNVVAKKGQTLLKIKVPKGDRLEQQAKAADAMEVDDPTEDSDLSSIASSQLSLPLISPAANVTEEAREVAPNRVLALCKWGTWAYWPSLYVGPSPSGEGKYQIRFDDGSIDSKLDARDVKPLKLRKGDQVKVDLQDMRKQIYIVQGFENKVGPSDIEDVATDVFGFQTVILLQKKRDSTAKERSSSVAVSVPIKDIYLPRTFWTNFQGGEFKPPSTLPSIQRTRDQTPSIASDSRPSTPSSRTRRQTYTSFGIKQGQKDGPPRSDSLSPQTSGVFSNMAFAVTFIDNSSERDRMMGLVHRNGGLILPDGFDELFSITPTDPTPPVASSLTLKPQYQNLGFTALLTDRHSRSAKYMQALALHLPILSARWVDDTLDSGSPSPIPYAPYLLPAGESKSLGAVRSLVLPGLDFENPAATQLSQILSAGGRTKNGNGTADGSGNRLLGGKKVLLVSAGAVSMGRKGKGKAGKETLGTFEFLVRAMGAARVRVVGTVAEREEELGVGGWDVVFVEGVDREGARAVCGVKGVGGDGPRAAGYESVVQSLILGKLVEG
ncbi:hypothetical protein EV356DRAFT_571459 [Viridothelium virens]|uniref:BRCT domain-containing protein n=1 Tax=Viridothelium virens TaxID=1048519 RepID=A0A6A6GT82_VIRVR|nr:hypothetical protein EV356DRAFT_571459 [Viridothelium virens]